MNRAVERAVRERARHRCEYCHLPEAATPFVTFHIDHARAKKHGGSDNLSNLVWSCQLCNLHKGTNLSGIDPLTDQVSRLFNPRTQLWKRHFEWLGAVLIGRTASGRATVATLSINDTDRVELRELFTEEWGWPED